VGQVAFEPYDGILDLTRVEVIFTSLSSYSILCLMAKVIFTMEADFGYVLSYNVMHKAIIA
jgi:hypothetical protein